MAGQVVALEPFATAIKGRDIIVHEGDVFAADDPVVKGRAHLFGPVNPARKTPTAPKRRR